LEDVAELLWDAGPGERGRLFDQPPVLAPAQLSRLRTGFKNDPLSVLQTALPLAAAADAGSYDLRAERVRITGARIVRLLAAAITRRSTNPVHQALQAAWAPGSPAAAEVIRSALVLCADHELNVSAFVARCAASAGASPYDVVSAALATLKGHRHGGATGRLSALFTEIGTPGRARTVISNRLRRGENLPGFGHPLYPSGDPRAALLVRLAEASRNKKAWRLIRNIAQAGSDLSDAHTNLDFGLVAAAQAYGLPDQAPLVLFALGRTIGWIAHAIEQYTSASLIRPRARYTGPLPDVRSE
jgi:citrate synthase